MTESQWLLQKRKEAENLIDVLPEEKVKYVSVPFEKPADSGSHRVYAAAIVQQDSEIKINLPDSLAKAGVIVKDIREAGSEYSQYFEAPSSRQAAANMAFFSSGVLILVPENAKLDEPLYFVVSVGENASVVSRNVIIAGKNSKLTIVQEIIGKGKSYYNEMTAFHAMENAALEFACVQDLEKSSAYIKRKAVCDAGSFFDIRSGLFGSESTFVRNEIDLAGERAEASTLDIYFGTGSQKFDSLSLVNHKARNTKSRSDVRGVLKDRAKLAPHGNVKIDKEARGSDAFLTEHILLLSSGAEADPVPALEIDTNDVKAGHSASVSHVDAEQVFYLMARGLPEEEAKKMIVVGFLEPALRMAETLRIHVMADIDRKWDENHE